MQESLEVIDFEILNQLATVVSKHHSRSDLSGVIWQLATEISTLVARQRGSLLEAAKMPDEDASVQVIPPQRTFYNNNSNSHYVPHYGHQSNQYHHSSGGYHHNRHSSYDYGSVNGHDFYHNNHNGNGSTHRGNSQRSRGSFRNNQGRQQHSRNYVNQTYSHVNHNNHHHNQYYTQNRTRGRYNGINQGSSYEHRPFVNRNPHAVKPVPQSAPVEEETEQPKRASSTDSGTTTASLPYLNSSSSSISSEGTMPPSPREVDSSQTELRVKSPEAVVQPAPVQVAVVPPMVCCMSSMTELSHAIWRKYLACQQTFDMKIRKLELKRELSCNVLPELTPGSPKLYLEIVGSTMSGFGSRNCDVDICLMIRNTEVDQRIEAVERLQEFQSVLRKCPGYENIELIYARVPILRFRDTKRNLDVDLNCNNSVGIRNTHLLSCYAHLDKRVQPLVVIVKLWAQHHRINDAKNMTISSYTLVLMVIHYLQFGTHIPVLPCLHKDCPDQFASYLNVEDIRNDRRIPSWESRNKLSVGELLLGFLEYFAIKFDYGRQVVSVRLGMRIAKAAAATTRNYKNDPQQWNRYLCVEEPFDLTNTARSVYDKDAFDRIRGVFYISWWRLNKSQSLDSVFHDISDLEAKEVSSQLTPIHLRPWY